MSSINQSWAPPMDAQDEATDLLVGNVMHTFGGICFNSSCKMIDLNGSGGVEMYNTWHIFGDPSVLVAYRVPATMTVNYQPAIFFASPTSRLRQLAYPRLYVRCTATECSTALPTPTHLGRRPSISIRCFRLVAQ